MTRLSPHTHKQQNFVIETTAHILNQLVNKMFENWMQSQQTEMSLAFKQVTMEIFWQQVW